MEHKGCFFVLRHPSQGIRWKGGTSKASVSVHLASNTRTSPIQPWPCNHGKEWEGLLVDCSMHKHGANRHKQSKHNSHTHTDTITTPPNEPHPACKGANEQMEASNGIAQALLGMYSRQFPSIKHQMASHKPFKACIPVHSHPSSIKWHHSSLSRHVFHQIFQGMYSRQFTSIKHQMKMLWSF